MQRSAMRVARFAGRRYAVIEVRDSEHFEELTAKHPRAVVNLTASWCGPCQMMKPKIEELAKQHPNVAFLKVDVDDNGDIAGDLGVASVPTFKVFKDGKLATNFPTITGAQQDKLTEVTEKLSSA